MNFILKKAISAIGIIGVLSGHWAMAAASESSNVIHPEKMNVFFSDIQPSAWYYDDVAKIVKSGIMKGKSKNTFDPEGKVTYAELAQILKNLQVPDASDRCPEYTDVPSGTWYTDIAISYGAYLPFHYDRVNDAIVFWPDFAADRGDVAYTLLQAFGHDESYMDETYMELTGERIIGWKRYPDAAAYILANKGIISGYANGELGEYDKVSRAQCAAIINRFLDAVENGSL